MPLYFFHTDGDEVDSDVEGVELPNRATARVEAIRYGGALLGERPDYLWDGHELRIAVTDEAGRHVVTVVMLAVDAPEFKPAPG